MSMIDNDLVCNFKKCRQRLVNTAWVTSCSHTFCDEDGSREFNKNLICPACEAKLDGKHDIVRHDLKPNEQYKSMILAGLKPEIIMEIASRAIAFWTYQAQQEKLYHEYSSDKSKESRDKLEAYYEQLITKLQSEIKSKTKDLKETKQRYNELKEQHQQRSRQHQKLQIMYDTLRRRSIIPANLKEFPELKDAKSKGDAERVNIQEQVLSKTAHPFQMKMGLDFLGSTRNIYGAVEETHQTLLGLPTAKIQQISDHHSPVLPQNDFSFAMKPFPTPNLPRDGVNFDQRFTLHINTSKSH